MSDPSNSKKCLYHPIPIPTQPQEIISMNCFGGLPTSRKGHDYLFVVVERFNKMCILIPYKKTIKGKEEENMFFEQDQVHFGIPSNIISEKDTIFLSSFWTTLWENMDTKLKRSTTFHPDKCTNISSQQDFGATFVGLQLEAYKDLG